MTSDSSRPTARFNQGDVVQRTNQPDAVGVVTEQPRWNRQVERWDYSVQIGGQVRTLPEDSLQPLVPIASPWASFRSGRFSGIHHFIFALTYHRLRRPPTRIAYSFATSRTQFYPHQFTPLLKFLDHPGKRLLIADDVGLGKTIEAGYILRELRARQVVERVLIVVPARLAPKWKREMQTRFDEPFDIVRRTDLLGLAERLRQGRELDPFRWIVSYENIRPDEVREAFEATEPALDVVIVDEAHRLRNSESLQHKAGAVLCRIADTVLFLSATPVHNSLDDLWNLLRLLSPDEFSDSVLFQNQIAANRPLLRAQRALTLRPPDLAEAGRRVDEFLSTAAGTRYADTELTKSVKRRIAQSHIDRADVPELQADIGRLSPTGHIITRTRKVDALPERPKREAGWIPVSLTAPERDIYDSVEALCRLAHGLAQGSWGLQMAVLQAYRMTASCIPAAVQYFARRLGVTPTSILGTEVLEDVDEDDEPPLAEDVAQDTLETSRLRIAEAVVAYQKRARIDTKLELLITALKRIWEEDARTPRPRRKVVVFSTFRLTLEYLRSALTERGQVVRMIHGGRPVDEREVAIDEFLDRPDVHVLLTSEVGGEGIDLQRACVVVNYDLPWNPMVVEQRIGRVDRIGQLSPRIVIVNLIVADTIEERILERLLSKIGIFEESIGELDPIIGEEIQRLTESALRGDLTPDEEANLVEQTGEALRHRVLSAHRMLERLDGLLAADQAIIDEINAVTGERQLPTESEMRLFLNEFLGVQFPGCQIPEEASRRVVSLQFENSLAAAIEDSARHFTSEASSIVRFARRCGGGPVELTLSREASYRHPQSELLHLRHPLVRFAVSDIERGKNRLHTAFALKLRQSTRLPSGLYVFGLSLLEIPANRPAIRLAFAITEMRGVQTWSDPEATMPILLELLEQGSDFASPPLSSDEVELAQERVVAALSSIVSETTSREEQLDHARREQQLAALQTTAEFRLHRARERLDSLRHRGAADFAIRMAHFQFDKAQQQINALQNGPQPSSRFLIEQEDIAVGIIGVGDV